MLHVSRKSLENIYEPTSIFYGFERKPMKIKWNRKSTGLKESIVNLNIGGPPLTCCHQSAGVFSEDNTRQNMDKIY